MEASTATAMASSTAEIEPEGNELQSSAVLAENSSPGLDENNTDSVVNELHELVGTCLKVFKRVHVFNFFLTVVRVLGNENACIPLQAN